MPLAVTGDDGEPRAPRVVTTADTPRASSAGAPPSSAASCSFGTTMSALQRGRPAGRRGRAEHGRCLSLGDAQSRRGDGNRYLELDEHDALAAAGRRRPCVGTRHDDDQVLAVVVNDDQGPSVGASTRASSSTSTPADTSSWRRRSPAASGPTAPMNAVDAPARDAAMAWLTPLPPTCPANADPEHGLPGRAGRRAVRRRDRGWRCRRRRRRNEVRVFSGAALTPIGAISRKPAAWRRPRSRHPRTRTRDGSRANPGNRAHLQLGHTWRRHASRRSRSLRTLC